MHLVHHVVRIKARYYLAVPQISISHFEPSHSYDHPHCNQKDSLRYGFVTPMDFPHTRITVRLGKSGLKVSRIILGMMSYGEARWQGWVLGEKEAIEHVKFA